MISFDAAMRSLSSNKVKQVKQVMKEVIKLDREVYQYNTDTEFQNQITIFMRYGSNRDCVSYQNHVATVNEFKKKLGGILSSNNELVALIKPLMSLTSIAFDNVQQVQDFRAKCKEIRSWFRIIAYKYNVIDSVLTGLMIQEEGKGTADNNADNNADNVDSDDVEYRL